MRIAARSDVIAAKQRGERSFGVAGSDEFGADGLSDARCGTATPGVASHWTR